MRSRLLSCQYLTAVGAALLLSGALTSCAPPQYRPSESDERPPSETAYVAALAVGLKGDYRSARESFVRLAKDSPRSNTGAWSLYQASLAAEAEGDRDEAAALRTQLRSEYSAHPLTLRVAETPLASPSRKNTADCGPRSLLTLCREAGIPATLPDLKRLCKTTKEGTTLAELEKAARKKGLEAVAAKVDGKFLQKHRPAGVAWVDGDHFVAFGPHRQQAWLEDPSDDRRRVVDYEQIAARSQGMVLLCAWGKAKLPEIR